MGDIAKTAPPNKILQIESAVDFRQCIGPTTVVVMLIVGDNIR